jgi:hypothetical protein
MVPTTVRVKVPYTVTECVPTTVCKRVKTCVPKEVCVTRCRRVPVCDDGCGKPSLWQRLCAKRLGCDSGCDHGGDTGCCK